MDIYIQSLEIKKYIANINIIIELIKKIDLSLAYHKDICTREIEAYNQTYKEAQNLYGKLILALSQKNHS